MNYLEIVGHMFLGSIPLLVAWLVGIIISVRMLRLGGEKAEKLLLAGCAMMFANQVIRPFLSGLATWLVHEQGMTRATTAGLIISIPTGVMSLAGIVCLIYAFWMKFRKKAEPQ
jgi:hypothetical protein